MRPTTAGLKAAMSATPRTLAWLGKFEFANGTIVRVSTSGSDVIFDETASSPALDTVWTADKSFKVSNLRSRGNGDVPDGEVTAPTEISALYDEEDVYAGTFSGMEITLWMVDFNDPSDGSMQVGPYTVSEIDYDDRGRVASFEVRGILQRAKEIQVEELAVGCRSSLGDPRPGYCNLPLYPDDVARSTAYAVGDYVRVSDAGDYHNRMFLVTTAGTTAGTAPSYDYTVGNPTTDGTAVFEAEEAWVRSGTVAARTTDGDFTATLTESRAVDGWFALGSIKWITGDNAGLYNSVRVWTQSTSRIQLWDVARWTVQVGDTFEIVPGCDKTFATCKDKFANTINFRGENLLPGSDFVNGAGL